MLVSGILNHQISPNIQSTYHYRLKSCVSNTLLKVASAAFIEKRVSPNHWTTCLSHTFIPQQLQRARFINTPVCRHVVDGHSRPNSVVMCSVFPNAGVPKAKITQRKRRDNPSPLPRPISTRALDV